ncbi:MAG: heparinase II/III family protein, partial [Victivallales bacterium]|nr:heparinase II/III family protein [Victivallales bacterium]
NSGGIESGNYGEPGLMWFAGLAAWKEGYCDELASELLSKGYNQYCRMMVKREQMSAGTGLLMHITSGYVFGAYPWASCNFLETLKSAANLDMTTYWTQMRDYPMFFSWMSIPNPKLNDGFCEFGWGDAGHTNNSMGVWLMYNHCAQVIHLYGDKWPEAAKQARAVIGLLPQKQRIFNDLTGHPYLPFILDKFDPAVKNDEPPAAVLSKNLAQHFPTFGLTVMRSGFSEGDTYASIKAGATVDQHQHYDENSFIIYKRGFQALDTGTRNNAPHHLIYYPQTVAHNAILIRMDDEPLPRHWYPSNAPRIAEMPKCDGGQNIRRLARSLGFDQSDYHVVTGGDATACYSAEKCREAVRQFVFVKPDYFVIYDRVTSMKANQQKVFLLHSEGEPTQTGGIWRSCAGEGALFTKTLLPQENNVEVIGGAGREFVAGGVNYPVATDSWVARSKGQTWAGKYRLEISPKETAEKTRFLHLLQAADDMVPSMVASHVVKTDMQDGVAFTTAEGLECVVMFNRDGDIGGSIKIQKDGKTLVERSLLKERPVGRTQDEAFLADLTKASRMDVYMPDGSLELVDDGNAGRLDRPQWLNNGDSFVAQFKAVPDVRTGYFTIRAVRGGKLVVKLMGPDVRDNGVIQKYMVEYSTFSVNGKPYLTVPVTVWHNAPRIVEIPVKVGDVLKLEAKFHALGKQ